MELKTAFGRQHQAVGHRPPLPEAGTYVMECWGKGPDGARFVDHSTGRTMALSPQWKKHSYEFDMSAGGRRRFVLEVQNLQGQSAWLDDLVVYRKDGHGPLEAVSGATGDPAVVTYADGICYINGIPTFIAGLPPQRARETQRDALQFLRTARTASTRYGVPGPVRRVWTLDLGQPDGDLARRST